MTYLVCNIVFIVILVCPVPSPGSQLSYPALSTPPYFTDFVFRHIQPLEMLFVYYWTNVGNSVADR